MFSRSLQKDLILTIDQGTTGTTIGLMDSKGEFFEKVSEEYPQIYPQPGWVEHRVHDIWNSVLSGIQKIFEFTSYESSQIIAIGITNQRETSLIWERDSERPIHNAIVWQCRRTTDFCEKLKEQGLEDKIIEKTGLVIDPYFSASKLKWLLDHLSGSRLRVKKGELLGGTVDSYLIWKLTQGDSHVTDVSNASRTQLMNINTGQWDPELLEIFSVPEKLLPRITPSSGILGHTKNVQGLPDGIPISGLAGDQQAALFGQTCFQSGEAKCTFGTGSFILMNTGKKKRNSSSGMLTTVAWQLQKEDITYALEGGAFICGAAVQWLRDEMQFFPKSTDIENLARSVDDSGGVEFVPALTGLGAPYWDPRARGMITGITRGCHRGHIARAVLDAMALQNVDILQAMKKDLKVPSEPSKAEGILKNLRVDGGATENDFLMQLQADYLGLDILRPQFLETTAAGAAYLAGLGVGLWSDLSEVQKIWKIGTQFEAQLSSEKREKRLKSWKSAVSSAMAHSKFMS